MTTQHMRASAAPSGWIIAALKYIVASFFALVVLIPLLAAVINGFKTNAEVQFHPFSLPTELQWGNYSSVLYSPAFWRQMMNSTTIMLATAFGVVLLSSMPAFVFSRMQFRGREVLFNFFTLGLLFPIAVAILPLYITLRQAKLVDSLWGIILPQVAFGLPANILILRGFFATIPRELEEAASMDGCTPAGFFVRVLLPLMRPAL